MEIKRPVGISNLAVQKQQNHMILFTKIHYQQLLISLFIR